MTSTTTNPAALETTLSHLLANDTHIVRLAERELGQHLKSKFCVPNLAQLACTSSIGGVRHLASVLLRKHIRNHWISLDNGQKTFVQQQLLHACDNEIVRVIRLNICYAVAALASVLLSVGKSGWPELLHHVGQWTHDGSHSTKREVGFVLLYAMSETIGTTLKEDFTPLCTLYRNTLTSETDHQVRMAALRGASSLIEYLSVDDDVVAFQSLVPVLIQSLVSFSQPGQELSEVSQEVVIQAIECLSELADSPVPVLEPFASSLALRLCEILVATTMSEAVKSAAAVCLAELIQSRPRITLKDDGTFQAILNAIVAMALLTADTFHVDVSVQGGGGGGEIAPREMLEYVVGALTENSSPKRVAEPLLNLCANLLSGNSPPRHRIAGAFILTIAIEGLVEVLGGEGEYFSTLLKLLLDLCHGDGSHSVLDGSMRRAGLVCIGQMTEYLQTDVTDQHAMILPVVMQMLTESPSPQVRRGTLYVVTVFCSSMEPQHLEPYVSQLCKGLLFCFSTAPTVESACDTLEALSALAETCGDGKSEAFKAHVHECVSLAATFMSPDGHHARLSIADLVKIRSQATQLLGKMLIVVDKYGGDEHPYLNDIPEMLSRAFAFPQGEMLQEVNEADYDFLVEAAYKLCADVVISLQSPRVDPFVPGMLAKIFEGCVVFDEDDRRDVVIDRDSTAVMHESMMRDDVSLDPESSSSNEGDDDDDMEDAHVPGRTIRSHIRESAADLKVGLLFALDVIVERCTPQVCLPSLPRVMEIAEKGSSHQHPTVRAASIDAMTTAIRCMFRVSVDGVAPAQDQATMYEYARCTHTDADAGLEWLPGLRRACMNAVEFEMMLCGKLHDLLLQGMLLDCSKEVAAAACDALLQLLKHLGPNAVPGTSATPFVEALVTLFQGGAACQSNEEQLHVVDGDGNAGDDDDDEDEERRHDDVLIDSVSDALALLAKVLGQQYFGPFLDKVLPVVFRFCKETMPSRDRITGTGCLAQLVQAMTWGPHIEQYLPPPVVGKILKLAHAGIKQTKDPSISRNSTFLLGNLAEAHLLTMEQTLEGLQALRVSFESFSSRRGLTRWDDENRAAAKDNACASAARLIMRGFVLFSQQQHASSNGGDFFLEPAVVGLLHHLPLQYDHGEDWVCYDALLAVSRATSPNTKAAIMEVAKRALQDPAVNGQFARLVLHELIR